MTKKIYLSDLMRRQNAIDADTKHDIDGWKIVLYTKGGKQKHIELARNVKLINDID